MAAVYAERDSVCMGDDVNAPNPGQIPYQDGMDAKAFLAHVADYIPTMHSTVWIVWTDSRKCRSIGALICDENGSYSYLPAMEKLNGLKSVFCQYFCTSEVKGEPAQFAKQLLR